MVGTYSLEPKMQVTIAEAAQLLGLSEKTVRRRRLTGRLQATQMSTYKGYTWIVEIPDDLVEPETGELQALRDRVAAQDRELETKNKQIEQLHVQIEQLHVLLQQAQAALPSPKDNRPWWRFWQR
jgi:predicted transcriptional regulator